MPISGYFAFQSYCVEMHAPVSASTGAYPLSNSVAGFLPSASEGQLAHGASATAIGCCGEQGVVRENDCCCASTLSDLSRVAYSRCQRNQMTALIMTIAARVAPTPTPAASLVLRSTECGEVDPVLLVLELVVADVALLLDALLSDPNVTAALCRSSRGEVGGKKRARSDSCHATEMASA